ncbi:MAG: preprotein translocase subunit YajC [Deltaproteobacteria bacterium]
MVSNAYALGDMGQATGGANFHFLGLMAILFVIFYFLLIRPQQKQQKEHKDMLASLTHGDEVVTASGIHGKVVAMTENIVTVEIADNVKVKFSRGHIAGVSKKKQ